MGCYLTLMLVLPGEPYPSLTGEEVEDHNIVSFISAENYVLAYFKTSRVVRRCLRFRSGGVPA
jgi:hypothetical protein